MFANGRNFWKVYVMALQSWRSLTAGVLNPYHPERYYMRGPGPKWRDKHPIK